MLYDNKKGLLYQEDSMLYMNALKTKLTGVRDFTHLHQ